MERKLPKGWPIVKLGEICELFNGKTPSKEEQRKEGHPILKIKDIDNEGSSVGEFDSFVDEEFYRKYKNKRVQVGDTLLLNAAHNAGYVGSKSFYIENTPDDLIATGEWMIIRANAEVVSNKFKHYWITSENTRRRIKDYVKGIHLYPKDLSMLPIPCPPLVTQHKIVEIIDKAYMLRKLRKRADEKMHDLIPSLFVEMFGDPATHTKKYPIVRIAELCNGIKAGPFGSSLKKSCYTKSGYRVYGQEQVIAGNFSIGDYYISREKFEAMKVYEVKPGDLLISLVGTIGKVVIVPDDIKPGIINPRLIKITPNYEIVNSVFLSNLLQHPSVQNALGAVAHGGIMGVLNATLLKKLKVLHPPLPLQQEFAVRAEEIETEKARQTESKKKLDELFNSLMQKAFTGELVA